MYLVFSLFYGFFYSSLEQLESSCINFAIKVGIIYPQLFIMSYLDIHTQLSQLVILGMSYQKFFKDHIKKLQLFLDSSQELDYMIYPA